MDNKTDNPKVTADAYEAGLREAGLRCEEHYQEAYAQGFAEALGQAAKAVEDEDTGRRLHAEGLVNFIRSLKPQSEKEAR